MPWRFGDLAWSKLFGSLLGLIIFLFALGILYRLSERFRLADILLQMTLIGPTAIRLALALTAGSYLALGGFDRLAVLYIGKQLGTGRVLLTSFLSHAISHSAGFATLSGGAVRYRLYSAAGLTAPEVVAVIGFCGVTYGLGACSLGAVALMSEPELLAGVLHLPLFLVVGLGVVLALVVLGYLLWGAFGRVEWTLLRRRFTIPRPPLGLGQIGVAASDLAMAAAALWVLLPEAARPAYPGFLGAYVVANLIGLLAHVPGGLGVFEAVILVLTPNADPKVVLGALLMFRLIYHLLPLVLAVSVLALTLLAERLPRFGRWVLGWPALVAVLLAFTAAGLLAGGARPL